MKNCAFKSALHQIWPDVCLCLCRWDNNSIISHIVQYAPACECNWVDQEKLANHSCRYCPWLPANQHAVVTLSQQWVLISLLIALCLHAKSEAIESKLSLVQAINQHSWLQTEYQHVMTECLINALEKLESTGLSISPLLMCSRLLPQMYSWSEITLGCW